METGKKTQPDATNMHCMYVLCAFSYMYMLVYVHMVAEELMDACKDM